MNHTPSFQFLRNAVADLTKAVDRLSFSYQKVERFSISLESVSDNDLEVVEAFCSRFSRVVDILINKVLRALDNVELLPQGTLIDTLNRAEKRRLISNSLVLREMKEIRNVIAHDYAGMQLLEVFCFCREQTPVLISIAYAVMHYASGCLGSDPKP